MKRIYDKVVDNEIIYYSEENGFIEEIKVRKVHLLREGVSYFLIYDNNIDVIRPVHRFLNIELVDKSINTRDIYANDLKNLYIFINLFNVDIYNMDNVAVKKLKEFLRGGKKKGREYSVDFSIKRSPQTINGMLAVFRAYLKSMGIDNEILNEKETVNRERGGLGLLGHTKKTQVERFKINEHTASQQKKVPRYIKKQEFDKMLEIIRREYTLREEVIIRIMYQTGARIGEVLGSTLEDYVEDGERRKLIIRNRLSDSPDQCAKTCMKISSKYDYDSEEYKSESYGYQWVEVNPHLAIKLDEYIDEAHGSMSKTRRKNYHANSKADQVTDGSSLELGNYYIFLNKNGNPLNQGGWNKILREIFVKAGVVIDFESKKHNLNHRFRHGYAMFLRKELNKKIEDIQIALRHESILTTAIYFRPDEDDIYEANNEAVKIMERDIPNLRR